MVDGTQVKMTERKGNTVERNLVGNVLGGQKGKSRRDGLSWVRGGIFPERISRKVKCWQDDEVTSSVTK